MNRIDKFISGITWLSSLTWFVLAGLEGDWSGCFVALICASIASMEFPFKKRA